MIAFGVSDMTKAYVGSTEVSKAYLGSELVWGGSSPTLPYDARIEYLKGAGTTTWINTNFIPTQDDLRVIVDAENTVNGDFIFWGIKGTNPRLNNDWYNRTRFYFRYRDYNKYFTTTAGRHTFETGPDMKIDGTVKATPTFSSSYTFVGNTKKIALFGAPNAAEPTSVNYAFTGKIYEFWVYYGDVLQMHLIPVRVGTTGYMYDTVSGELFGNSGTGSFTLGPDVI